MDVGGPPAASTSGGRAASADADGRGAGPARAATRSSRSTAPWPSGSRASRASAWPCSAARSRPSTSTAGATSRPCWPHVSGQRTASQCKNCHKGHGPWNDCVVVDGQMCGSCANCWFNASGSRCSFHGAFFFFFTNSSQLYSFSFSPIPLSLLLCIPSFPSPQTLLPLAEVLHAKAKPIDSLFVSAAGPHVNMRTSHARLVAVTVPRSRTSSFPPLVGSLPADPQPTETNNPQAHQPAVLPPPVAVPAVFGPLPPLPQPAPGGGTPALPARPRRLVLRSQR